MRWDRFFEDLEDQLASEWEAERAALDTEAERLRLARVLLRDRLTVLAEGDMGETAPVVDLADGTTLTGRVTTVGADWIGLDSAERRSGAVLVPLHAVVSIGLPHADLLRSARPPASPARGALADRMTLGFVLRDLVRRRVPVTVALSTSRTLSGTIDRAGADHLDLALHDPGSPRRTTEVTGHRVIPLTAVVWVRLDGVAALH